MAASVTRSGIRSLNLTQKRLFDLVLLCPILLVTAPVMVLVALAIRVVDGKPILFRQLRLGIGGKPFELLKFRTMRCASDAAHREYVGRWIAGRPCADANGALYKMTSDPRITGLGALLRRFSIDELPQLLNVLRGDMSLIGPRPAIPYEVRMYQDWHRRRLDALPGLTGLWQVSGRNRLSFDEMVRLDINYIEHWSLARDLAILARTPRAVIAGEGC
jgi:lipopolysaccharide/colanic/teichoic acid biosynthesis glycosyltransferase